MTDQVSIEIATPNQVEDIARFYDRHGYKYKDLSKDVIAIAKSGGTLTGAGRGCEENGVLILRGMQVLENFQKAGVGRTLLKKLDQVIGSRECFTLPWSHLERFYGSIGFRTIELTVAPPHLRDRAEQ